VAAIIQLSVVAIGQFQNEVVRPGHPGSFHHLFLLHAGIG
jgi:hypothetical protein